MNKTTKFPFYYGWITVAIALLSIAFWMGILTTFSVFFVALLEEFHWSRGGASGVQATALIFYTITAPFVGGLIDRFGPRRVILPGMFLLIAGLLLCSQIDNLIQFYVFYGIVTAIGFTTISIVPYSIILSFWFEKKRGLASGIAVSGMGLGTFVLVPLMQHFISIWGWRWSYVAFAAMILIVLFPVTLAFLRYKPQDIGLTVDGIKQGAPPSKRSVEVIDPDWAATDWKLERLLKEGRFWALLAFCFFAITGVYTILVHGVRFMVDQGLSRMTAAYIFSIVGIISLVLRVFWGWLSDRIGREITFTVGMAFIVVGYLSLVAFERTGARALIYLYCLGFGTGWAVTAPMFMAVAADLFQGKRFGLIYGILEAIIGTGSACGAWFAGFIFDTQSSYQLAFLLSAGAGILSCLFVWLAAPRRVRRAVIRREV